MWSTCGLRTVDDMKVHTVSSSVKGVGTVALPVLSVRVPKHAAHLKFTPFAIAHEAKKACRGSDVPIA
jgi:hypothetical protein